MLNNREFVEAVRDVVKGCSLVIIVRKVGKRLVLSGNSTDLLGFPTKIYECEIKKFKFWTDLEIGPDEKKELKRRIYQEKTVEEINLDLNALIRFLNENKLYLQGVKLEDLDLPELALGPIQKHNNFRKSLLHLRNAYEIDAHIISSLEAGKKVENLIDVNNFGEKKVMMLLSQLKEHKCLP